MRIAYLITSYRAPDQLLRLLTTLRRGQPDSPIVVHHDRFRSAWNPELVEPIGGVTVLTSPSPVSWGDFSIVDATWRSLSWMVQHAAFDWVMTLSEQDYPITPFKDLEEYLGGSGVDAFVEATPLHLIEDPDSRIECDRRYNYQYVSIPRLGLMERLSPTARRRIADRANRANFILYKLQKKVTVFRYPDPLPMRLGLRPRSSPFSAAFPCWQGSQWLTLSRRAAEVVVDFIEHRPDYVRHCSRNVIPDESATQTIVWNDHRLHVCNERLHRLDFKPLNDGHPEIFGLEDLDDLIHSDRFFARKFDLEMDGAVLDALDDHIFGG